MRSIATSIMVFPKSVTGVSVPVYSQALICSHKVIMKDALKLILKVFSICKALSLLQTTFCSDSEKTSGMKAYVSVIHRRAALPRSTGVFLDTSLWKSTETEQR